MSSPSHSIVYNQLQFRCSAMGCIFYRSLKKQFVCHRAYEYVDCLVSQFVCWVAKKVSESSFCCQYVKRTLGGDNQLWK